MESNNADVDNAIKNNGNIVIDFYYEQISNISYNTFSTTGGTSIPVPVTGNINVSGTESINSGQTLTWSTDNNYVPTTCYSNTISGVSSHNSITVTKETGITEKGNQSKQKFVNSNLTFRWISFHTINWKILPYSQKTYTVGELNVLYCSNCAAKRKKTSFKFCPYCGTGY